MLRRLILFLRCFLPLAAWIVVSAPLWLPSDLCGSTDFVGKKLPWFSVTSGDDKTADLSATKGKLTILFYESRYAVSKNGPLKDFLKTFFHEQSGEVRERVLTLPVIDCSSAYFPIKHFWKKGLIEHSRKEGLTIFGDWDGKMRKDLGLKEREAYFFVIDRAGIIRYFAAGKIDEDSYESLKSFLLRLVTEAT